jgi:hypothetical protein
MASGVFALFLVDLLEGVFDFLLGGWGDNSSSSSSGSAAPTGDFLFGMVWWVFQIELEQGEAEQVSKEEEEEEEPYSFSFKKGMNG